MSLQRVSPAPLSDFRRHQPAPSPVLCTLTASCMFILSRAVSKKLSTTRKSSMFALLSDVDSENQCVRWRPRSLWQHRFCLSFTVECVELVATHHNYHLNLWTTRPDHETMLRMRVCTPQCACSSADCVCRTMSALGCATLAHGITRPTKSIPT